MVPSQIRLCQAFGVLTNLSHWPWIAFMFSHASQKTVIEVFCPIGYCKSTGQNAHQIPARSCPPKTVNTFRTNTAWLCCCGCHHADVDWICVSKGCAQSDIRQLHLNRYAAKEANTIIELFEPDIQSMPCLQLFEDMRFGCHWSMARQGDMWCGNCSCTRRMA